AQRGLRRVAGDVRDLRRPVLAAGVAGLHRAVVAAVADGPPPAGGPHGLRRVARTQGRRLARDDGGEPSPPSNPGSPPPCTPTRTARSICTSRSSPWPTRWPS